MNVLEFGSPWYMCKNYIKINEKNLKWKFLIIKSFGTTTGKGQNVFCDMSSKLKLNIL
jgi:hypothetical protein